MILFGLRNTSKRHCEHASSCSHNFKLFPAKKKPYVNTIRKHHCSYLHLLGFFIFTPLCRSCSHSAGFGHEAGCGQQFTYMHVFERWEEARNFHDCAELFDSKTFLLTLCFLQQLSNCSLKDALSFSVFQESRSSLFLRPISGHPLCCHEKLTKC